MWKLTRLLHSGEAAFYLASSSGIARQIGSDAVPILRTACCQGGAKIPDEDQASLQTSLLFYFCLSICSYPRWMHHSITKTRLLSIKCFREELYTGLNRRCAYYQYDLCKKCDAAHRQISHLIQRSVDLNNCLAIFFENSATRIVHTLLNSAIARMANPPSGCAQCGCASS